MIHFRGVAFENNYLSREDFEKITDEGIVLYIIQGRWDLFGPMLMFRHVTCDIMI